MSRRANELPATELKLQLDPGLAVDLDAFCKSNRGQPPKVRIIREAIRAYIDGEIARDVDLAGRFTEVKAVILANVAVAKKIRLVRTHEKDKS